MLRLPLPSIRSSHILLGNHHSLLILVRRRGVVTQLILERRASCMVARIFLKYCGGS